jgi:hypothetical protein
VKTEPAFPVVGQWYGDKLGGQLFHGMTLRDYFAAKAMQGMIVDPGSGYSNDELATFAYAVADAMLQAREA